MEVSTCPTDRTLTLTLIYLNTNPNLNPYLNPNPTVYPKKFQVVQEADCR